MDKLYIYGASGHGLVIADIAQLCGYKEVVFIDDGKQEYKNFEDIKNDNHIPMIIGIGDNKIRAMLQQKAQDHGFCIATLVHPSAIISPSVAIGKGVVIMPNVVVNAKAVIGDGAILNSSCIIEHECKIGDFAHISPNAAFAGNVSIGSFTHIGIGCVVIQGLSIGQNCIIGAASVVIKNIDNNILAYGNPCKVIKEIV